MSFAEMKKEELLDVADKFAVDVKPTETKAAIIEELEEMGVSYDQYYEIYKKPEMDAAEVGVPEPEVVVQPVVFVEKEPEPTNAPVLVRMLRANPVFEIRGYRFTKNSPFALVKPSDADYLIENQRGFRIASPREAEEFYS